MNQIFDKRMFSFVCILWLISFFFSFHFEFDTLMKFKIVTKITMKAEKYIERKNMISVSIYSAYIMKKRRKKRIKTKQTEML